MTTGTRDHVSPLTAMLYPGYTKRCEHCGGFVAMSPEEALTRALEAAYQPLSALAKAMEQPLAGVATGLPGGAPPQTAPTDWLSLWTSPGALQVGRQTWRSHGHHHHHHHHHAHHHGCGCGCGGDCGCEPCGRDDCHCRCCVVDADLVVNARLGERRVVPLTIENNRRRERELKLELSEFTSRGGSASGVTGELLSPATLTLAACSHAEVVIGINVGDRGQQGDAGRNVKGSPAEEGGQRMPDVDDCAVAYADLRIAGCDHRPIRIAVATLPRGCHDYRVDCGCGCC